MDKENSILKGRLATLKDEMEDATEKMNEMTEELRSAQIRDAEHKGTYVKVIHNFDMIYLIYYE